MLPEHPSAKFFSHIKLSKCAYFWWFSHINITSDSDSTEVIIMPLMAKIHCLDSIIPFMGALNLCSNYSIEFSNL